MAIPAALLPHGGEYIPPAVVPAVVAPVVVPVVSAVVPVVVPLVVPVVVVLPALALVAPVEPLLAVESVPAVAVPAVVPPPLAGVLVGPPPLLLLLLFVELPPALDSWPVVPFEGSLELEQPAAPSQHTAARA